MIDVDFISLIKFNKRPFRRKFIAETVFSDLDEFRDNFKSLATHNYIFDRVFENDALARYNKEIRRWERKYLRINPIR